MNVKTLAVAAAIAITTLVAAPAHAQRASTCGKPAGATWIGSGGYWVIYNSDGVAVASGFSSCD